MGVPVSWQMGVELRREISTFLMMVSRAPRAAEPGLPLHGGMQALLHVGGEVGGGQADQFKDFLGEVVHGSSW